MNYTNEDLLNMFFEMYPQYKPVDDSNNLSERDTENIVFYWISMLITKRLLMFGEVDNDHYSFEYIRKKYTNLGRKPKEQRLLNVIYTITGETRNVTFIQKNKFLNDIISDTGFDIHYGRCCDCGNPLKMNIKGKVITVCSTRGEPCMTNGFHKFHVKFPSGKVVASDGLPGMFEMFDRPENVYLNDGLSSEVKYNDYYAEKNIAHMFVGNNSPTIYLNDGKILGAYSEDDGVFGYRVGKFCTDLWWATFMDHDEYIIMLKELGKSEEEIKEIFDFWTFNVFDIEPGTYEFTSRYSSFDEDEFDGVYFEAVKVSD